MSKPITTTKIKKNRLEQARIKLHELELRAAMANTDLEKCRLQVTMIEEREARQLKLS